MTDNQFADADARLLRAEKEWVRWYTEYTVALGLAFPSGRRVEWKDGDDLRFGYVRSIGYKAIAVLMPGGKMVNVPHCQIIDYMREQAAKPTPSP